MWTSHSYLNWSLGFFLLISFTCAINTYCASTLHDAFIVLGIKSISKFSCALLPGDFESRKQYNQRCFTAVPTAEYSVDSGRKSQKGLKSKGEIISLSLHAWVKMENYQQILNAMLMLESIESGD